MNKHNVNGLAYYQFDSLPAERVMHAVFTRLGGVSRAPFESLNLSISVPDEPEAVEENRRRFYTAIGVDRDRAIRTRQVHGARVAAVDLKDINFLQKATDGLVTATPGLPLVMAFADCTPILLYDPVRSAVGIVHAGWRGTVAGVCPAAVKQMVSALGCRPGDIQAAIGPAIGPCCYQVGSDVVEAVGAAFGRPDGLFRQGKESRLYFDLWAANEKALRESGVQHVEQAMICTACRVAEFYSHRAEKAKTGRFGAVIMLR